MTDEDRIVLSEAEDNNRPATPQLVLRIVRAALAEHDAQLAQWLGTF